VDFIFQILLVFILVFLNGFFVASEFSLVSVRKTRIDELVNKGNKPAKLVQKSIKQLNTFISATQLGITLASLALGWIGEPAIAHFLEPLFNSFFSENFSLISAHGLAIIIAFTIITFLHIVIGELMPKTIALQKAESTALFIIAPLELFTTVFRPFIWTLNKAGDLTLRIFGFSTSLGKQLVHSEEEIKMILAQSVEEGALEKQEVELVYSVFKMGDIPVKKIMVPKSKIIGFEKNTLISEVIKSTQKYQDSRFPVYEKTIDSIVGFIHIKDIYRNLISESKSSFFRDIYKNFLRLRGEKTKLSDLKIIRKIPWVKETDRLDDVLILLRRKRTHIAVVYDKYGKTAGIVALDDVVESLVGEIKDEFDEIEKEA
jgi:putative hemolysin